MGRDLSLNQLRKASWLKAQVQGREVLQRLMGIINIMRNYGLLLVLAKSGKEGEIPPFRYTVAFKTMKRELEKNRRRDSWV